MIAKKLFKWNRFDLPIKHLFLKFYSKGIKSDFAENAYKEHLKLWNNFKEYGNPNKNTYDAFKSDFINIFNDIKNNNFNWEKSPVVIDNNDFLLNGAHRVTSASLLEKHVECKIGSELNRDGQKICDYRMFNNLNLSQQYKDAAALELARLNSEEHLIISLFPAATHSRTVVENIISKYCGISYKKDIWLNNTGAFNYMLQLYKGEAWAGGWSNNFAGFREKARLCFTNKTNPMTVYLVNLSDLKIARQLKEEIRKVYNIGNHSVHINDTPEETLRLARCLFNENSIHFLNNSKLEKYVNFQSQINYYEEYLIKNNLDIEDYCITGSSVLSIYGLREGKDLDYLHFNPHTIQGNSDIRSHNEYVPEKYSKDRDDIIFNPNNHFYFGNLKVASLEIIKSLKETQSEYSMIKTNKENISVLFLWKNDQRIIDELNSIGQINEIIPVKLYNTGRYNLLDQIHYGKPWWEVNLIKETDKRIQNNEFTAYIFTGERLHEKIKTWKYNTRNKLGLDKTYFHVSDPDCHKHLGQQCNCKVSAEEYNIESIRHVNMIKHKNTFDFINQRTIKSLPNFDKCLKLYHDWLPKNSEEFVIDNGGVLGAYGIRDTHDVDFLCYNDDIQTNSMAFGCENKNHRLEYERLGYSIKDIIDNPDNYFYHYGMKFMSLSILQKFKLNRTISIGQGQKQLRPKDQNDCTLINNFLNKIG